MKLLKIYIFITPIIVVFLLKPMTKNWICNSNYSSHRNVSVKGEKPQSYKLMIDLVDENYRHTFTMNEGDIQIVAKVYGKTEYLCSNNISQIMCNYKITIDSENKLITGNIDFQAATTTIGFRDKISVEDDFKKYIIDKLIKEIKQI